MTPAPISVERLRELLDKASEWRCTGDVLRCTDGNGCECDLSGNPSPWMDLQNAAVNALPALLQQLAEREAEVERLRIELEVSNTACGEYASQAMQASFRAQEAERAREEATWLLRRVNASLYLLDKPHREFGGVTDKTATDIAAFLAASGGGRED